MLSPIEVMPQNGGVPIRLFLTPDLLPDAATLAQLESLANVSGLEHHVAGLPDIHRKSRNPTPTGTVVVAKNALVPRAVDAGVNCGMRILRTDIDVREGQKAVVGKANVIGGKLARRYRLHYRTSNSNASNTVDLQAAYETEMSTWGAVLGGANLIYHAAGWLEGGLTASYEKLVLDV